MNTCGKFRKKPVVIEAFQYLPDDNNNFIKPWWFHGVVSKPYTDHRYVTIETFEGAMKALPGDWIILGVKGEQYPCKNDVFVETYEEV